MGRAMVDRAERSSGRRGLDLALVVAAGVVLLFAVVGVVSAGSFVAGKVSGSSVKATATPRPASNNVLVAQDIHRAQAQATAIVRQAQSAGHSIVASANAKARRQASVVLASARHQAAAYRAPVAAAPAPAPLATSVPVGVSSSSGATANGAVSVTPQVATGSVSSTGSGLGTTGGTSTGSPSSSGAAVPDLRGVPSTWLVVGYNATFASGSSGVGTISVVNRSGKTFGGVAIVKYKSGGSARASFSGLAPGQSLVLPLLGSRYLGGSFQIMMSDLH